MDAAKPDEPSSTAPLLAERYDTTRMYARLRGSGYAPFIEATPLPDRGEPWYQPFRLEFVPTNSGVSACAPSSGSQGPRGKPRVPAERYEDLLVSVRSEPTTAATPRPLRAGRRQLRVNVRTAFRPGAPSAPRADGRRTPAGHRGRASRPAEDYLVLDHDTVQSPCSWMIYRLPAIHP
jgi:hypothetical protein